MIKNNKKIEIKFYLYFSLTLFVLLCLGTWQVERYRTSYIEKKIVASSSVLSTKKIDNTNEEVDNYRKVEVFGTFINEKRILLHPRTMDGKVGVHLLVPLKLESGYIIINRGFIGEDDTAKVIESLDAKNIRTLVQGIAFKPPVPSKFLLKNDLENNNWYTLNLDDMNTYLNNKSAPYIIYESNNVREYLYKVKPTKKYVVNHLQYAVTWYSLAICLISITIIFVRKRFKDECGK